MISRLNSGNAVENGISPASVSLLGCHATLPLSLEGTLRDIPQKNVFEGDYKLRQVGHFTAGLNEQIMRSDFKFSFLGKRHMAPFSLLTVLMLVCLCRLEEFILCNGLLA